VSRTPEKLLPIDEHFDGALSQAKQFKEFLLRHGPLTPQAIRPKARDLFRTRVVT